MKVLDLFSGIGGFSLGLERAGMETIAFCEFDKHAQKILKKHWPDVPIFEDVRTLDATKFRGSVDIVCGGFPCQDLSGAGNQAGFSGERSSLYREMLRIISESRPRFAIFENVTGLLTGESGRWFGQFLYDLAQIGYDAEWHCIPASYVGAHHRRDRVWIIAYSNNGHELKKEAIQSGRHSFSSSVKNAANADLHRFERLAKVANSLKQQIELMRSAPQFCRRSGLPTPAICGSADGVPDRTHRLKQLGNAVVPQIPEAIGRAIMQLEDK